METKPDEEKINFDVAIVNMIDRDIRFKDKMDIEGPRREELLSRVHAIKSLNIRFRKQYNEMNSLLHKHEGKELDFLQDKPGDFSRTTLIVLVQRMMESRTANGDTDQLSSEQIEEDHELCCQIDQQLLKWVKLITLREEFIAQVEIDNARIEKLLNQIRK